EVCFNVPNGVGPPFLVSCPRFPASIDKLEHTEGTRVREVRRNPATARQGEEPETPLLASGPKPTHQRSRIVARQPLRLGHLHFFPSSRSTTQQPRRCGPSPRQWSRTSVFSHPASWSASARMGIAEKSRESYIPRASNSTVSVPHRGSIRPAGGFGARHRR